MNDKSAQREYDVVVWGASGFTGRLVVEYLQENYGSDADLRWAVAARNPDKMATVLAELGISADKPAVLIADSNDAESLDRLAGSTRVVLTTVGPYAKYGSELVRACAEHGTHYCDLAGEAQWIRAMIDQHQALAERSGARIVNCCGFDSIPSDIGVQFLQEEAQARSGAPCDEISLVVRAMKGGASGGTIASMLTALEQASEDRNVRRILADPYSLNPADRRSGNDQRDQTSVQFDHLAEIWTAPFVMAAINTRVVRRTNALLDFPYGKDFVYRESTATGGGATGWLKGAAMTAGLGGFVLASSSGFLRENLVKRFLPKPGEGPSQQERENGFFNMQLYGKLADGSVIRARVTGDRDPGYGSTCKMLSESALCLSQDELTVGGGFWTPAAALGPALRKRLVERAGLTFSIE